MPEIDRSPADSSSLERGEIPEVADLGKTLTDLFNTLGVSQRAYAVRITLHPSAVSRYLGGQRVATQDFVDRLIREAENKLGTPLQEEARARLHDLRLAAVRATDPAAFELESLRREMERSQRAVERLTRQQEALHDLLEKREGEAARVRAELARLHRDWAEDSAEASRRELDRRELDRRAAAGTRTPARDSPLAEIARLRADLADTAALKSDAETRCRELEDRVLAMEEEIAGLQEAAGEGAELAIGELLRHLERLRAGREVRALGRILAEAAWERPAEEIAEVLDWLQNAGEGVRAESMLRDVAQARPLGVVAATGDLVGPGPRAAWGMRLVECAAQVRSVRDLAALHLHWAGRPWYTAGDLLACLITGPRPLREALELVTVLREWGKPVVPSLRAVAQGRAPACCVPVLAELAYLGDGEIVRAPLTALMDTTRTPETVRRVAATFSEVPADRRRALVDLMAGAPLRSLLDFLDALGASPESTPVAQALLEAIELSGRGVEVRAYRGHRARVYPERTPDAITDGP